MLASIVSHLSARYSRVCLESFVAAGKDNLRRSVLSLWFSTAAQACAGRHCAVKKGSAELCAPITWCSLLLQPVAPFVPTRGNGVKKAQG